MSKLIDWREQNFELFTKLAASSKNQKPMRDQEKWWSREANRKTPWNPRVFLKFFCFPQVFCGRYKKLGIGGWYCLLSKITNPQLFIIKNISSTLINVLYDTYTLNIIMNTKTYMGSGVLDATNVINECSFSGRIVIWKRKKSSGCIWSSLCKEMFVEMI